MSCVYINKKRKALFELHRLMEHQLNGYKTYFIALTVVSKDGDAGSLKVETLEDTIELMNELVLQFHDDLTVKDKNGDYRNAYKIYVSEVLDIGTEAKDVTLNAAPNPYANEKKSD